MRRESITAPYLSTRDREALVFIGEGYEVAQYQLRAATFAGRSPTVVSRFVMRSVEKGLLHTERFNGSGMNRLRLTPRAIDVLETAAVDVKRLFAPRRHVALKDLAHTLRLNDLRLVLRATYPSPTETLTAWFLQRSGASEAVPDLLAMWRDARRRVERALAAEIDLGTENLERVFFPKLERLARLLFAEVGERGAILFLRLGAAASQQSARSARAARCLSMSNRSPKLSER